MGFNAFIKLISTPFKLFPPGEAPVKYPAEFKLYHSYDEISDTMLDDLVSCYILVYSKPPWNEVWDSEMVKEKLARELSSNGASLIVMEGNSEHRVAGFHWSAVIPLSEVPRRTVEAHQFKDDGVEEYLREKLSKAVKGPLVLFDDESALLPEFRGGIAPLQFLIRYSYETAIASGVIEGLIWTSWKSKAAALSRFMGFNPIGVEVEGIVFLYNPDIRPLLKMMQNVDGKHLEKIITLMDGFAKTTRRIFGSGSNRG
jgi:hypothetical protein